MLTHVIVRFVDGQFIMDEVEGAREQYLIRLDRALLRADWTLCWYALMGTHVHLALVCGEDPLETWARALHSGWANWINRKGRRRGGRNRGPVLADRPTTVLIPDDRVPQVGAYIHNNPVRARVVERPEQCDWTSHRAYIGLEPPLPSLDIATGLSFYACTPSEEGRKRFHEYVLDRRRDPRAPELSGSTTQQARRLAREVHGSTAELATGVLTASATARHPICIPSEATRGVSFTGSATEFLHRVAPILGVGVDWLCGPGRNHQRARQRELVVLAWRTLGRRPGEIGEALQISRPAVSNILARTTATDATRAGQVVLRLTALGDRHVN